MVVDFLKRLEQKEIIVADGAMGTTLQVEGLTAGQAPEEWNLSHPEIIKKTHKSYLKAGAELIVTNTLGGNPLRLKEAGLKDEFENINQKAVKLAREARDTIAKKTYIAGSVGPTGKMIKPLGILTAEEVFANYQQQIAVLVTAGVEVIIIETMVALEEMEQALAAAAEFSLPLIAEMSFQESKKTIMGASIKEMVNLMNKYPVSVIGFNCTPGAGKTLPLVKSLARLTDKPLSVFPNAGKPHLKKREVVYPEKPANFVRFLNEFIDNQVKIIGGCCGTTTKTIKAIKTKIANR